MALQTSGVTTNKTKLVSWDIDDYLLFNDDDGCLVCLTPRDMYLLRNSLRQMQWKPRWTSEVGTAVPDIQTIAENLGFKMSLSGCVDLCQAITDCINDPESGVGQSIINIVADNSSTEQIVSAQNQSGLILGADNNPTCDPDILWGGINHLVNQLNTNNLDALQILEVVTNVGEWVTDVVAGVFGVKAPILQSILEWAVFIQDNILENYEAQITTEYMDTIKCGIFCLVEENCELTASMLVDYFFDRLSSQLSFGSVITESLEFIVLGVWSGTEIADALMLSQLVFRAQLGYWFSSINFRSIDLDMRLGYNDPSDDWSLLCTTCIHELCFNMSSFAVLIIINGFEDETIGNPIPSLLSESDFDATTYPYDATADRAHQGASAVQYVFPNDVTISELKFDVRSTFKYDGQTDGVVVVGFSILDSGDSEIYRSTAVEFTYLSWTTYTKTIDISGARKIAVWGYVNTDADGFSGACWIDNFCMEWALD